VKVTPRTRKVNETVKEALAAILIESFRDPRLELATITGVDVSRDLAYADVYVIAHGDEERYAELLEGLESAKGRLRSLLGERVSMRHIPALRFHIDTSVDTGMRISEVLAREQLERPIRAEADAESVE
jgi:ribosome-binding factor A